MIKLDPDLVDRIRVITTNLTDDEAQRLMIEHAKEYRRDPQLITIYIQTVAPNPELAAETLDIICEIAKRMAH